MLKLVVLISGGGSNLRSLLEAAEDAEYPARVVAIGADRDADGLAHAEDFGIPTFTVAYSSYPDRESWGAALLEQIQQWEPDLVVLFGHPCYEVVREAVLLKVFARVHPTEQGDRDQHCYPSR